MTMAAARILPRFDDRDQPADHVPNAMLDLAERTLTILIEAGHGSALRARIDRLLPTPAAVAPIERRLQLEPIRNALDLMRGRRMTETEVRLVANARAAFAALMEANHGAA